VAEGQNTSGASGFEVRGAVVVDQQALKKSLGTSQQIIESWATNVERIVGERADPGKILARGHGHGRPEPKDPTEPARKGAHNTGSQFSHLARIIREVLAGPLAALSPELGKFVSASAAAARSARFYGAAIGAAVVAAVVFTEVLGKYFEQANKATEATLEAGQALATLDFDRSSASTKKMTEELAKHNLQLQQVGNDEYTVWQQIAARIAIVQDTITSGHKQTIAAMVEEAKNQANILLPLIEIPKALAEAEKKAADVAAKRAQMAISEASSTEEIGKAYDDAAAAVHRKNKAAMEELRIKELQERTRGEDTINKAAIAGANLQQIAQLQIAHNKNMQKFSIERRSLLEQEAFDTFKSADDKKKALAQAAADAEDAAQKEIDRNLKRVQDVARSNEAIAQAEEQVAEIQRKKAGAVESASALEDRLQQSRANATGPIVAGIQAATDKYQSQKRALEELIDAGKDVYKNTLKLTELEKSSAEEVGALRRKLAEEEVTQNAKAAQAREERIQKEIAAEEKRFTHRVNMGRATVASEMEFQRAASNDPRRSVDQREDAEEKLLALRKSYADQYFKYYQELGASTWAGQVESARGFLSETVEGSKAWFDQVTKISDIYKQIHDQSKGIFSQELGIAASEAQREGRKQMRIGDVDKYVDRVRRRDEKILAGGSGKISDVTAAFGRQELWKTVDREGLSPREAFARSQQDPARQLAETLAHTMTRQGAVAERQAAAVQSNVEALNENTQALRDATSALAGVGRGNDVNPPPTSNASTPGVLRSEGPRGFANTSLTSGESAAVGRDLLLSGRRGPQATESAL
jgi:hypothetical protein